MPRTYPKRSLHGSLVHELGKRVVKGVYPQGATLPVEDVLREELKVSRNALREAIKVLSAKGLLSVRTRTGTQVQPKEKWHLTDPDVLAWALSGGAEADLFAALNEFRAIVEPAAAEAAARRASDEDCRIISRLYEELEASSERGTDDYVDVDMAFHQAIFDASGNPFLQSVSAHVSGALAKSRKLTHRVKGANARTLPLHREVAEAIADHDADRARRAMAEIFQWVAEDLRIALGQQKD